MEIKFNIKAKSKQKIICEKCGKPFHWRAKSGQWEHDGCKAKVPTNITGQSIFWEFGSRSFDPKRNQTDSGFVIPPHLWSAKDLTVVNDPSGEYEQIQVGIRGLKEKILKLYKDGFTADQIRNECKAKKIGALHLIDQDDIVAITGIMSDALKSATNTLERNKVKSLIHQFRNYVEGAFASKFNSLQKITEEFFEYRYVPKRGNGNPEKTKAKRIEAIGYAVNHVALLYQWSQLDPSMTDKKMLEELVLKGEYAEVPMFFLANEVNVAKWKEYLNLHAVTRPGLTPLSKTTKQKHWEAVRTIYEYAYDRNLVFDRTMISKSTKTNWSKDVVKSSTKPKYARLDDIVTMYDYQDEEYKLYKYFTILMMETGMRYTDIRQMVDPKLWEDGNKPWGVEESNAGRKYFFYHRHKTQKYATIPMNDRLREALEYVLAQIMPDPLRLDAKHRMPSMTIFGRELHKFQYATIKRRIDAGQHLFRRTFAQLWASSSHIDPKYIPVLMGHKFSKDDGGDVTWEYYAEANPNMLDSLPENKSIYDLIKEGVTCEGRKDISEDYLKVAPMAVS